MERMDLSQYGTAPGSYNELVKYLLDQYSSLSPDSLSPDTPLRGGKAFGTTDDPAKLTKAPGKNVSATEAKVAKAMGAAKATTPNASSNSSRHRKLTPSPHPQEPEYRNGWEEEPPAIAGQLPQWTAGPFSVSSTRSTPAHSDEFERPLIVFTA
jgi:hypothetical protein